MASPIRYGVARRQEREQIALQRLRLEDLYARTIEDHNGCYIWQGAKAGSRQRPYGQVNVDNEPFLVHRISLGLKLGRPLLPNMRACHQCDVPLCIRQEHLFEGTQADNMRDASSKERIAMQKLTAEQVLAIRASSQSGAALGRLYGVERTTINEIKRGDTWKHLLPALALPDEGGEHG